MGGMMYIWRISQDCPDEWIAVHDKSTVDPVVFRRAIPFEGGGPLRFSIQGRRSVILEQDFLPNSTMIPLVSVGSGFRLKNFVGDAIQIVPTEVCCDDGVVEFFLINILTTTVAVDWAVSKATLIPGTNQVMKFTTLGLLSNTLYDRQITRLDEYRSFVLASKGVREIFLGSKLCEFIVPTEVRA